MKINIKFIVVLIIVLLITTNWYINIDYSKNISKEYSERLSTIEADLEITNPDVANRYYYRETDVSFTRVKTYMPFVFKKINYKKTIHYASKKKP